MIDRRRVRARARPGHEVTSSESRVALACRLQSAGCVVQGGYWSEMVDCFFCKGMKGRGYLMSLSDRYRLSSYQSLTHWSGSADIGHDDSASVTA